MDLPNLPKPPDDYGYLVQLLVALGSISIIVFGLGIRFAVKQGIRILEAYLAEKRQELIDAKAEAAREKLLFDKKWEASEEKRERGRNGLTNLVKTTTIELSEDINKSKAELTLAIRESSAGLDAKIEVERKSIADLHNRLQRLERKRIIKKPPQEGG